MTKKTVAFLALTVIMLGSLYYATATITDAGTPRTLKEFKPEHIWLVIGSATGIFLWFWALYDWGMKNAWP
jgi:hypothetical protein